MNIDEHNNLMFRKFFQNILPETVIDQSCPTASYNTRLEEEVQRLLNNPEELLAVDIDALSGMYKLYHGDMLELGERIHRYYVELAERQAMEYI